MTIRQNTDLKLVIQIIALLVFVLCLIWLLQDFDFQPLVGLLTALATFLATFSHTEDKKTGQSMQNQDIRNRKAMLNLVRDFWISGVLEQSLHGMALIELGIETRRKAVDNRLWDIVVQSQHQADQILPQKTKISEVFSRMGQTLLILGEPGSGKTTVLLELARELIEQAESNPKLPIPVVFNLASWTPKSDSIDAWLEDELHKRYLIPRALAKFWIGGNNLAPLLDGLDEVNEKFRVDCVRAINMFRQKYGLVSVAVCSRTNEYQQLGNRLQLQGAVVLQPLSDEQIDGYLTQGGKELLAVRATLAHDPVLRQLVTSPLILSILVLAYREVPTGNLYRLASPDARRKHLFEAYINQMFRRYGASSNYELDQIKYWLSWLASKMKENNQSLFLLESLQPTWLSSYKGLFGYFILSRLILGAILGLLSGVSNVGVSLLSLGVDSRSISTLMQSILLSDFLATYLLLYFLATYLLITSAWGLIILGPLLVALELVQFRWPVKHTLRHSLKAVCVIALFATYVYQSHILMGSSGVLALLSGVLFSALGNFIVHQRIPTRDLDKDIQQLDALDWSWRSAGRGFIVGALYIVVPALLLAFLLELSTGWLRYALVKYMFLGDSFDIRWQGFLVLTFASICGTLWGGISGIQPRIFEGAANPNQRTWRTLRNGVAIGVALGILIVGSVTIPFYLLLGTVPDIVSTTFFVFLVIVPSIVLYSGGITFLYHFILRLILNQQGLIPWKYAPFLDFAAKILLLRRVGSGYIFIHRLVLEHFASLECYGQIELPHQRSKIEDVQRRRYLKLVVPAAFAMVFGGILGYFLAFSFATVSNLADPQAEQLLEPAISPMAGFMPVVGARKYIPKGAIIAEDDVVLYLFPDSNIFILAGTSFDDVGRVIGLRTRVPLDTGMPLHWNIVEPND
jgi:eukaryotic-like serine/threonine-protein kinase